jgi:hypothetical protein
MIEKNKIKDIQYDYLLILMLLLLIFEKTDKVLLKENLNLNPQLNFDD